ncbi:hypothetical protein JXA80_14775 [bacterium]|nr:hypothetical protein [candidate division CSSED10-310 bacterium]
MSSPPPPPPYPVAPPVLTPLKHSGLGITSLILSAIIAGGLFILIIVAGILETSTPGGIDEDSVSAMIIGLFVIMGGGMELIALILGLIGLFQKERKKLFAILGTIFSSLTILGIAGLIMAGLATQ